MPSERGGFFADPPGRDTVKRLGHGRDASLSMMRCSKCLIALLLCLGMSAAAAAAGRARPKAKAKERQRKITVAVLEIGALGLSSGMKKNIERLLYNSIATIGGVTVIPPIDVEMALQNPKNRAVRDCGGGPECAVRAGRLVRADRVVFGTVSSIGENFALNLRVMDVGSGAELKREQSTLSGNRNLLIPELRLAAYRLVAPESIRGSLLIEVDVAGAVVEIDGKNVGTTPLAGPIEGLKPGAHTVVVRREGYSEFQKEITIRPFETPKLKLELGQGE